jgi:hypothetical protein
MGVRIGLDRLPMDQPPRVTVSDQDKESATGTSTCRNSARRQPRPPPAPSKPHPENSLRQPWRARHTKGGSVSNSRPGAISGRSATETHNR